MKINNLLLEGEVIKVIKNYPDYYISNLGRCFTTRASDRYGKGFRLLKHRNHPTGYKYVGLYRNVDTTKIERRWLRVHRIVADSFIGTIARNMVVDHINETKGDNRVENLQILTSSQNKIKSVQYRKQNNL